MRHGYGNRWKRLRRYGERGATLVEYALGFTFLVVLSISGLRAVTDATQAEVGSQADCISTRPAPPSCQPRPASTTTRPPPPTTVPTTSPALTTTTIAAPTTTAPPTTIAPPTTAGPTTTAPPPAAPTFGLTKVSSPKGVTVNMTVKSGTANVANAVVNLLIEVTAPGGKQTYPASCTTNASGQCTYAYTSVYTDVTKITVTVESVASNPPAGALPAAQSVTFP